MKENYQTFDFFVGKISPFLLFEMEFHSLFYIVEKHKNDTYYSELNPASQVSSIGLMAYFEAFCKHQFAAIVNIFPALIREFASKRGEPKVEFSTIISFSGEFEKNIGFFLAENYDFGNAKAINGIFRDLLSVTPFSKEDEKLFNEILYRRNLLVHHAGYFTLQYFKDNINVNEIKQRVFKQAIKVNTDIYREMSDFLFGMAMKITRETVRVVKEHAEFKSLSKGDERIIAVDELLRGVYDNL